MPLSCPFMTFFVERRARWQLAPASAEPVPRSDSNQHGIRMPPPHQPPAVTARHMERSSRFRQIPGAEGTRGPRPAAVPPHTRRCSRSAACGPAGRPGGRAGRRSTPANRREPVATPHIDGVAIDAHAPVDHEGAVRHQHGREHVEAGWLIALREESLAGGSDISQSLHCPGGPT